MQDSRGAIVGVRGCRTGGAGMQKCRDAEPRGSGITGIQECGTIGLQQSRVQGCRGTGVQGCSNEDPEGLNLPVPAPAAPGKRRRPPGAGGLPGAGAGRAGWGSRKGSPAPPPLGESCGSRREACEYTQTLWSLPCKSWQDAASSELIHVRSPARSFGAGGWGPCPGGLPAAWELGEELSPSHPSPARSF